MARGSVSATFWSMAAVECTDVGFVCRRSHWASFRLNAMTATFSGLRVASFESRNAAEMQRLIERSGGKAFVSPSMREVPVAENRDAIDFANRLITGQIDVVIFMTGIGVRHLLAAIERHVNRARFLAAISDIVSIARGPKPAVVLKELGIEPTYRIPEPNTWREIIATVDARLSVAQQTIGLVEYGQPSASLVAGLEARGAHVESVQVYKWDLPEELAPLEENIRAIAATERDVVLFTAGHQAVNVIRVAERLNILAPLQLALQHTVVASIGPTTSETLRELELSVDIEPEHPKMGHLVAAAAERAAGVLQSKRRNNG